MSIINKRQSIRRFNEKEVEVEKINKIIEAGMLAPSSKNKQPWRFVILDLTKVRYTSINGN
ncbi:MULTISPECIES: nitroreductase family protein [Clostridium]|jgi:nitroreductase|uniref:nitroreductase family protein n=1 Tax=Clostridium TaxID=1485 RepID=UPI000BE24E3E|nr:MULTISPECIES: nitroreductase family protein [Clostridium]MBP1866844.1 nitroreductase [Clostridium tertium]MBS5305055.1 nitroreductase family protein [Clostridium sp.]MDB1932329.1 nitroreductase family protein [Clostridium tertium]MDB1936481.1 nitroreductase family protein [Clostridium tertium]MDB1942939.1 nitroreductase family protein [Clostridium tertium]